MLPNLIEDWRDRLHYRRVLEMRCTWQRLLRWSFYATILAITTEPFAVTSFGMSRAIPLMSVVIGCLVALTTGLCVQAKLGTPPHVRRLLTVPGAILLTAASLVVIGAWLATGQWGSLICTPVALFFGLRLLVKEAQASLTRVKCLPYQRSVAQGLTGRGEGV